jgi:hypothetical protein
MSIPVRHPVLEITATVEPFENGKGFSLRVLRTGKPGHIGPKALKFDCDSNSL